MGTMRVCLSSWAWPWLFAPYGAQLRGLIKYFDQQHKDTVEVYFLNLGNELPKGEQDFESVFKTNKDKMEFGEIYEPECLKNLKFIGGFKLTKNHVLASDVNTIIRKYKINSFLYLGDMVKFIPDTPINACTSFAWYPSHYNVLPKFVHDRLNLFTNILSLAPSDAQSLQETFPDKKVVFVPHFIHAPSKQNDKKALRAKHNIPEDAFVVFVHCGNYESYNRKSLDTTLFAFEEFQRENPKAFLLLHAWSMQSIKGNEGTSYSDFVDANLILPQTSINQSRLIHNNKIISTELMEEYFDVSDVLLHGSKVEGFGLPVLEAQMRGLPVVTNGIGAMRDYTYYGETAPPLQREYFAGGGGIWYTPHIEGLKNALHSVETKLRTNDEAFALSKTKAQETISSLMSEEAVVSKIHSAFIQLKAPDNHREPYEPLLLRFMYDEPTDSFIVYENNSSIEVRRSKSLTPDMLMCKWALFMDNSKTLGDMDLGLCLSDNDIIFIPEMLENGILRPTVETLSKGIVDVNRDAFMCKANIVKMLFGFQSETISNDNIRPFILRNILGKTSIGYSDATPINA
jgi:glycosyltransferase involved in cell wall biosynthesis